LRRCKRKLERSRHFRSLADAKRAIAAWIQPPPPCARTRRPATARPPATGFAMLDIARQLRRCRLSSSRREATYTARVTRDRSSPESSAQQLSALQRTQVKAFTSYSQLITKLILLSLSEAMGTFTYLDIAPPSPTVMSLSYPLYLRGSRGLLSNLTPALYDLAKRFRPLDTCLPHEPTAEAMEHIIHHPAIIIIHSDTLSGSLNILNQYSYISWTLIVLITRFEHKNPEITTSPIDGYTLTRIGKLVYIFTSTTLRYPLIQLPEAMSDTPTVWLALEPLVTSSRNGASSIAPLLPMAPLKLIPHNARLDELERRLVESATTIDSLESSINALLHSHSWRITSPLRKVNKALTLLKSHLQR